MIDQSKGVDQGSEFSSDQQESKEWEAVEALEETIEEFQAHEQKQFSRARFEEKAARGGQRIGKGSRAVLEFMGDSLGLLMLKRGGRRDLTYKLLKGTRKAGETLEAVMSTTVTKGGKLMARAAEEVDVDYLRDRAQEVKEDMTHKVKDSEVLEKIDPDYMKGKAKDLYHNVSDKVQEGKEKLFKQEDPEEAKRKQEELEERIRAFEKLYEDEAREEMLQAEDGYTPEEFKESK